ncbi:MAG: site-2 protease family protein [Candidatus Binatia bacterium]
MLLATLARMEIEAIGPLIQKISLWAMPILLAVVLHELAHGYVAFRLGDPTAARAGRLTLNPLAHVDIFGTVLLPLMLLFVGSPFLFGYAKPVPVNFMNLRNPRRDMVLVALAGPLTNLTLAGLSALALNSLLSLQVSDGFLGSNLAIVARMAQYSVLINVGLAVFNLLPVPPLDGGRVATGLLPRSPALALARLEPYGMLIILALLMTGVLDQILRPMALLLLQALL